MLCFAADLSPHAVKSVCMALGLRLWHNQPPEKTTTKYTEKILKKDNLYRDTKILFRPTGNWFIWVKKKFNWCDFCSWPQLTVPGLCKDESEIFSLLSKKTEKNWKKYGSRDSDKDVINFRMKWSPPTGLTGHNSRLLLLLRLLLAFVQQQPQKVAKVCLALHKNVKFIFQIVFRFFRFFFILVFLWSWFVVFFVCESCELWQALRLGFRHIYSHLGLSFG